MTKSKINWDEAKSEESREILCFVLCIDFHPASITKGQTESINQHKARTPNRGRRSRRMRIEIPLKLFLKLVSIVCCVRHHLFETRKNVSFFMSNFGVAIIIFHDCFTFTVLRRLIETQYLSPFQAIHLMCSFSSKVSRRIKWKSYYRFELMFPFAHCWRSLGTMEKRCKTQKKSSIVSHCILLRGRFFCCREVWEMMLQLRCVKKCLSMALFTFRSFSTQWKSLSSLRQ